MGLQKTLFSHALSALVSVWQMTALKSSSAPSQPQQGNSFSHRPGYRPRGWRGGWSFTALSVAAAQPAPGPGWGAWLCCAAGGLSPEKPATPGRVWPGVPAKGRGRGARFNTGAEQPLYTDAFFFPSFFFSGSMYWETLVSSVSSAPERSAPAHSSEYLEVSKAMSTPPTCVFLNHLNPARPQRKLRNYFFASRGIPKTLFPTAASFPAPETRWGSRGRWAAAAHRKARSPAPGAPPQHTAQRRRPPLPWCPAAGWSGSAWTRPGTKLRSRIPPGQRRNSPCLLRWTGSERGGENPQQRWRGAEAQPGLGRARLRAPPQHLESGGC